MHLQSEYGALCGRFESERLQNSNTLSQIRPMRRPFFLPPLLPRPRAEAAVRVRVWERRQFCTWIQYVQGGATLKKVGQVQQLNSIGYYLSHCPLRDRGFYYRGLFGHVGDPLLVTGS